MDIGYNKRVSRSSTLLKVESYGEKPAVTVTIPRGTGANIAFELINPQGQFIKIDDPDNVISIISDDIAQHVIAYTQSKTQELAIQPINKKRVRRSSRNYKR